MAKQFYFINEIPYGSLFSLDKDEAFSSKVKSIEKLWDELKALMKDRELKLAAFVFCP